MGMGFPSQDRLHNGNGAPDLSLGGGKYHFDGDATHRSDFRSQDPDIVTLAPRLLLLSTMPQSS